MASIKIPVIYTSYPFSVEATEYSLRMEKNRHSLGIATGFTVALLMFAVIGKLGNSIDADEIPSVLGLLFILCPVAGGVISGIYAEKLRKRYFMKKIRQALEKSLYYLEKRDPVQAAYCRQQVSHILDGK